MKEFFTGVQPDLEFFKIVWMFRRQTDAAQIKKKIHAVARLYVHYHRHAPLLLLASSARYCHQEAALASGIVTLTEWYHGVRAFLR